MDSGSGKWLQSHLVSDGLFADVQYVDVPGQLICAAALKDDGLGWR